MLKERLIRKAMWSAYNLIHVYGGDSPQADHLVIFNIPYVTMSGGILKCVMQCSVLIV